MHIVIDQYLLGQKCGEIDYVLNQIQQNLQSDLFFFSNMATISSEKIKSPQEKPFPLRFKAG